MHCYEGGENCQSKLKPRAGSLASFQGVIWQASVHESFGHAQRWKREVSCGVATPQKCPPMSRLVLFSC